MLQGESVGCFEPIIIGVEFKIYCIELNAIYNCASLDIIARALLQLWYILGLGKYYKLTC